LFGITACLFQFVVSELASPFFDLAEHFLPLSFYNVLVHIILLIILRMSKLPLLITPALWAT